MEYILELLFGHPDPNIQFGIAPMVVAGAVAGVGKLIGGLFGAGRARRQRRAAAREKRRLQGELNSLEKSRQKIINPYDNFKNLSSLAKDLSGKLSNPYANLGVATKGAEIQMEQTDIALANTLDTLRATGASAGGATALAQAALQSKQGVAASIEQQEAANEKARAAGQQQLEQLQMQEGIRVQSIQIGEGQRMQQADAAGRSFMFNAQEKRQDDKIRYTRGQILGAQQRETAAYNQGTQALMGAIAGATKIGAVAAAGKDADAQKVAAGL
tara:strand:- start:41 stop:856 length:816 start_codon:yes stop_codon:yes gene_type:complete